MDYKVVTKNEKYYSIILLLLWNNPELIPAHPSSPDNLQYSIFGHLFITISTPFLLHNIQESVPLRA